MTRDEMISWLIDHDKDYINHGYGDSWLASILEFGFEGYAAQPDNVLRLEILERDEEAFDKESEYA